VGIFPCDVDYELMVRFGLAEKVGPNLFRIKRV